MYGLDIFHGAVADRPPTTGPGRPLAEPASSPLDVPLRPPAERPPEAPPAPTTPGPADLSDERRRFAGLQRGLGPMFARVFSDRLAAQTVVVVPSLTLPREELTKLQGAPHYEERLLCLLMLLRLPRTRVVYVTSQPVAEAIVDYYLHLLPGVPVEHARRRLTLLSCHDASPASLTEKILARPRLVERIRAAVADPASAHVTCFNTTPLERSLAVRLGLPLYGCDPALAHLGTKSGSRETFRRAGVAMPPGFERLRDERDVADALAELRRRDPALRRAVVKLEEGFSGEGNAVFAFDGAPEGRLAAWVRRELPRRLRPEAPGECAKRYLARFAETGGIVEAFVEGVGSRSPSAQCRIDPLGGVRVISTHDQVLGGPTGQIFLGCTFPAVPESHAALHEAALRVAHVLKQDGVLGRFAVDFVAVRRPGGWEHLAIEINLRKGGTTHPYLMLQFLTDGDYDVGTGLYRTATGQPCHYFASDNLHDPAYRGLTPGDLIDIAVDNGLHFDAASQQGVVFHLIGALSEHGKLGALCVGPTPARARELYDATVAVLDREVRRGARPRRSAERPSRRGRTAETRMHAERACGAPRSEPMWFTPPLTRSIGWEEG
jgi:hypothetical protein